MKAILSSLPYYQYEIVNLNIGIYQRPLKSKSIYFIVKGEHYYSTVWVLHLNMATLAADLLKSKSLQCTKHLFSRI